MGKCDGLLALALELVVYDVEHFQEGHIRVQIIRRVIDEFTRLVGSGLAPDAKGDGDELGGIFGDHGKGRACGYLYERTLILTDS